VRTASQLALVHPLPPGRGLDRSHDPGRGPDRRRPEPQFSLEKLYDLTSVVPDDDQLNSAIPDWSGRLWFVSRFHGVVGALDQQGGEVIDSIQLDEPIENSFAADEKGGVYIVSDAAMYRFDLGKDGQIEETWREPYQNSGLVKPGQFTAGSGTTPTVMGNHYVAITDNADPMNVVVYRRAANVGAGRGRVVCEQPVFEQGASATENSLIGTDDSLIVENNYGYAPPPTATQNGDTTTPGIERVDVAQNGKSCRTVWKDEREARTTQEPVFAILGVPPGPRQRSRNTRIVRFYPPSRSRTSRRDLAFFVGISSQPHADREGSHAANDG
jgi:hypothetical protein